MPPADRFPFEVLGDVLAPAAHAINDRVQAPIAMCGQSVIAVAALATQGHANVLLPIGRQGQDRPLSCYFVSVASTGERKSACDREAMWPVSRREMALREEHDRAVPDYQNDKLAWEKARDTAVKKSKGDRASIKAALDKIGPAPTPPLLPMLTCPEPTFEGLCKLFPVGQPSLGIFAAEGGQFIGGHGMSDDAKLRTAAGLSDVWDGSPIRRVRSGDGVSVLVGRRLSVHLMAQPGVADILFRDHLLADQGLLSRLLATAPDPASGTRLWHAEQPETEHALRRYGARMLSIFEHPLPLRTGTTNELEPRAIPLSTVRGKRGSASPIMSSERSLRTAASIQSADWPTNCPSMRRGWPLCSRSLRTSTLKKSPKLKWRQALPWPSITVSRRCGCSGAPRSIPRSSSRKGCSIGCSSPGASLSYRCLTSISGASTRSTTRRWRPSSWRSSKTMVG